VVLLPKHTVLLYWAAPLQRTAQGLIALFLGPLPFHEDSSGMYALLLLAPLLGMLTALGTFVPVPGQWTCSPSRAICALVLYFILFALWEYGWAKVTTSQFYLPEPNTVYTPLGQLSKDIAYWSVIGSSRPYVVFLGAVEVLAGVLLVFRRTRFLGLLMAFGIFLQVCMVNISFDISMKLYAACLLVMTVVLLGGHADHWRALVGLPHKPAVPRDGTALRTDIRAHPLVLAVLVFGAIHPTIAAGLLHGDREPSPETPNAYRIHGGSSWKNVYLHSAGYIIVEDAAGQQSDRKITANEEGTYMLLNERTGEPSQFRFIRTANGLAAAWDEGGGLDTLELEALPYRDLPLLRSSFHLCADDYH
jgi:hypothetical protein